EIAIATEVVMMPIEFESEFFAGGLAHLERFARDFRPGAVSADDCDIVTFHESYSGNRRELFEAGVGMLIFSRLVAMEFYLTADERRWGKRWRQAGCLSYGEPGRFLTWRAKL